MMREQGITYEQARAAIVETLAAKRVSTPKELGDARAYLRSVKAIERSWRLPCID